MEIFGVDINLRAMRHMGTICRAAMTTQATTRTAHSHSRKIHEFSVTVVPPSMRPPEMGYGARHHGEMREEEPMALWYYDYDVDVTSS